MSQSSLRLSSHWIPNRIFRSFLLFIKWLRFQGSWYKHHCLFCRSSFCKYRLLSCCLLLLISPFRSLLFLFLRMSWSTRFRRICQFRPQWISSFWLLSLRLLLLRIFQIISIILYRCNSHPSHLHIFWILVYLLNSSKLVVQPFLYLFLIVFIFKISNIIINLFILLYFYIIYYILLYIYVHILIYSIIYYFLI